MIFSKSFGYAVRGVLYIAFRQDVARYVQVEQIASSLGVPRHFMGKILKRLAKEGVINSTKGPMGGFTVNDHTLSTPLSRFIEIIKDPLILRSCVLQVKECNGEHPCPMHFQVEKIKNELNNLLRVTTIKDLLDSDKIGFIKSISSLEGFTGYSNQQQQTI